MSSASLFAPKKTTLPAGTTKASLLSQARPVTVTIDGRPFVADAKEFSTGSVGWGISDKVDVTLADGTKVRCQVGLNVTIIGSKEVPQS